jgi:hypothetical protein
MKKISLDDILITIEKIRSEQFPGVPEDLVRQIIEVEASSVDDERFLMRQINQLVDRYIDEMERDENA